MRKSICLLVVGLMASAVLAADWRATKEEVAKTPGWMIQSANRPVDSNEVVVADVPRDMKLFLLIGQSNMSGRGSVDEEDRKAIPRCLKLNRDGKWVAATSPIHFDRPSCGTGIANTFVHAYLADHPSDTVGLIPCAVGWSPSATWSPEDAPDPVGSNYRRALARARHAQANGTIVGILWHQGETDLGSFPNDPKLKDRYVARLGEMAQAFRRGLNCPDVPFLVGEMGTLPKDRTGMNPILAAAVSAIPRSALVEASDLTGHLSDNIHFDTPSYAILGVRYYDAWKRLSEGCQKRRVWTDVLRSADLSALKCPAACLNEISRTFLLTNGVLVANAEKALVLESPDVIDCADFVLTADVRYEDEGFVDSGLQLCVMHPDGGLVRSGIEYQLKTGDIGDGWGLPGVSVSRDGNRTVASNQEGYSRMPCQKKVEHKVGVWHRVSVLKRGSRVRFFFDGAEVNGFNAEGLKKGRIGFQTKPYPEGRGRVSFRNVRAYDIDKL